MPSTPIDVLYASRLFCRFTPRDVADVLDRCAIRPMAKGAALCRRNERPAFLHVVLSGKVGLFAGNARAVIDFYGPGEALVLPAVMLHVPCPLSVRMVEAGLVLFWPAEDFRRRLENDLALNQGVSLVMAHHWQTMIDQIRELKTLTASERLGLFLLDLVLEPNGRATITLPVPRTLIAARLGVTPQSLSRAFAVLRPVGVNGSGRRVTIDNPTELRTILADGHLAAGNGPGRTAARGLATCPS